MFFFFFGGGGGGGGGGEEGENIYGNNIKFTILSVCIFNSSQLFGPHDLSGV